MIDKDVPRTIKAWISYDWANSVHSLVIGSAVFPIYYAAVTFSGTDKAHSFLGFQAESALNFTLALSFLIVAIISPILSAIADEVGNKVRFMRFFCYLGAFSCMGIFFFTEGKVGLGLLLNLTANIGFWGSIVFYNSYLPEIASEEKLDIVSAKGYMFGYIGSVVLLGICLIIIFLAVEEQKMFYTRCCFLLTGVWWIGFAQYALNRLPSVATDKKITRGIFKKSFKDIGIVFQKIRSYKQLSIFLIGFFFYSLGMHTIFLMAALFGSSEIGIGTTELVTTVLLIQIEAVIGAWLFSYFSGKIGNKITLMIGVFIWIIVCGSAFMINSEHPDVKMHFYLLAALIGLVMGGIQSLSRSTYAKLLPDTEGQGTTYFSFYDILEKIALFVGLFLYGLLIEISGGMKVSALAMGISFLISFIIFFFLKMDKKGKAIS